MTTQDTAPLLDDGSTATYSPEDNKLRLYPGSRLDPDLYRRVKAAGFIWAPKQELFVAPMWTPERNDLLVELVGDIGDEDKSLVERSEERADRFDDYSDKRGAEANRAREHVASIADNIPLGQPILVGHHSERHARRDAKRIEDGMRKAVQLWETSNYWTARAKGAIRAAKYKERPDVRARRIKGLQADKRRKERSRAEAEQHAESWKRFDNLQTWEMARQITGRSSFYCSRCFTLAEYPRTAPASQYEGAQSLYGALGDSPEEMIITPMQARDISLKAIANVIADANRWIAHIENRLAYETAMLDEQGATQLLAPKPRSAAAVLPLLNYRAPGGITCPNRYHARETIHYIQIEMTAAEYARINKDYKGTSPCEKTHRIRTAMVNCERHGLKGHGTTLAAVFLTDSKVHEKPEPIHPPDPEHLEQARLETGFREDLDRLAPGGRYLDLGSGDKLRVRVALQMEQMDAEERKGRGDEPIPVEKGHGAALASVGAAPASASAGLLGHPGSGGASSDFEKMRQSLKAGVQVVAAPQLFPTPPDLARRLVRLAEIEPGMTVLEPSAGTGCLVEALRDVYSGRYVLTCVEINLRLCGLLRSGMHLDDVRQADFTTLNDLGQFDRIVMNPPFERGSDIRHIQHARQFLKPGGKLVAICANGPRQQDILKPEATEWIDLPAGSFAGAGTGVNTAIAIF